MSKKGTKKKAYLVDEMDVVTIRYSFGKEAWQCTISTNLQKLIKESNLSYLQQRLKSLELQS